MCLFGQLDIVHPRQAVPYPGITSSCCACQAEAIEKAAMTLLTHNTTAPFNLTLLNLGAASRST